MRLGKINVYQLASLFFNVTVLLEKDPVMKRANQSVNEQITTDVFEPEMSWDGLRTRQLAITTVAAAFAVASCILYFLIGLPVSAMFKSTPLIHLLFSIIFFTMLGISIHIALFRGCRASLDEIRFKKEGRPKTFKINKRAHIRWYDFLAGIPFGLLAIWL